MKGEVTKNTGVGSQEIFIQVSKEIFLLLC
jgi:hypothetical protein